MHVKPLVSTVVDPHGFAEPQTCFAHMKTVVEKKQMPSHNIWNFKLQKHHRHFVLQFKL